MLIPLSTGIDNISTLEDFDSHWDSWNDLAPVVQTLDSANHWINRYPADKH